MVDLKTARLKKNMSQADLSRAIDISEVQISRYEQGHSLPHPTTRKRIEEVLGPVDWPDQGRPLTANEQQRMFHALQLAAERLGSLEDAINLFANQGPDKIRKLTRSIAGKEEKG